MAAADAVMPVSLPTGAGTREARRGNLTGSTVVLLSAWVSECRPGELSGPRNSSLSASLPLHMRHRGSGADLNAPKYWRRGAPPEPP